MNGTEKLYVDEAFRDNMVIPLGPNVNGFENTIKEYTGIGCAVALSLGTAAMHQALKLAGIKQGDVGLCRPLAFCSSTAEMAHGALKIGI